MVYRVGAPKANVIRLPTVRRRDRRHDHDNWVAKRSDFDYVLCLDMSRWGRFPAAERAVVHSITCQSHGKYVIYTAITKLSVPTSGDES